MKKMRKIIAIITVVLMLVPIVLSTSVQAITLGIEKLRKDGYAYEINQKDVWKIVNRDVTPNDISNPAIYAPTFYCLKPTQGFGSSSYTADVEYTVSFDMKKPSLINTPYTLVIPSSSSNEYNALLWMLDNFYDPNTSSLADRDALLQAAEINEAALTGARLITDSDIEVVQQIALWYLTTEYNANPDDNYHFDTLPSPYISQYLDTISDYDSIFTREGGAPGNRLINLQKLYTYFITKSLEEAPNYGTEDPRELPAPIIFENLIISAQKEDTNIMVGPFKITTQGSRPYTLNASVTDGINPITNYKIFTKSGSTYTEVPIVTDLETTIKSLANTEFYIGVPTDSAPDRVKLDMSASYADSKITYWSVEPDNVLTEQPVVEIERIETEVDFSREIELPEPYSFQLLKREAEDPDVTIDGAGFTITTNPDIGLPGTEQLTSGGGKISFDDLEGSGDITFTITETTTPIGYLPLQETIIFTINRDAQGNILLVSGGTGNQYVVTVNNSEKLVSIAIDNIPIPDDYFDLALRKYITAVNGEELTGDAKREPTPQASTSIGRDIDYKFPDPIDPKSSNPVIVKNGDIVTYTIRVYNEGTINGYVKEIKDDIPEGLEFLPTHPINVMYGWVPNGANSVKTDYWSKDNDEERLLDEGRTGLMYAFDWETEDYSTLDYRDVQIAFRVIAPNSYQGLIKNIAEIKEHTDENGDDIEDKDSVPDNDIPGEDDIDDEYLILEEIEEEKIFDLALRKFITEVEREGNNININAATRYPVPQESEQNTRDIFYKHNKTPLVVTYGDIITYTIRVYNEGEIDGYVQEITDNLPEGIEFLPTHPTNVKYGWEERTVENGRKEIYTRYWSQEETNSRDEDADGLIKARDMEKELPEGLDYRDVQVAFKFVYRITQAERAEVDKGNNKIIRNVAEISEDSNEYDIPDKDSEPGNGGGSYKYKDYTDQDQYENEDDIDFEQLKTEYFDLALKKYVTKAIVTVDGVTKTYNTGHTGDENPEPPAKVEINRKKINSTVVKFAYTIKITNEGQIAGYAKEIKDHIPAGLKYIQADNPKWSQIDADTVVTRALENTLLQPGESASVEIILTWINGANNLGLKVNIAEISEDYNETKTPDIDSTPDNWDPKRPYEDDEDEAPVLLTISQGAEQVIYVVLPTMIMGILGVGIYLIKSKVLGI